MRSETLRLSKAMVGVLEKHGITTPTPIQKTIIPAIFDGSDVIAQSETGSGKTLSFAIPIIERMNRADGLRVLVLVPTRELAAQIAGEFIKFSEGRHLGVTPVYGGVSINEQRRKLERTNIVVGTPGRLLDMIDRKMLSLAKVTTVVLDEADRMLDMGFIRDIEKILKHIPAERQTMLFSATISKEITQLSKKFLHSPKQVQMASSVKPELLHQTYYETSTEQKLELLVHLLKAERNLTLVFCNRKHITQRLAKNLSREGVAARCLNGNMSQSQRDRATSDFRHGKYNVLVATDVAARGLDIDGITHVYNYEIPRDVESYTHRVGRTARAGKQGEAISLVARGEEKSFFQQILFTYRGIITLKTATDVIPLPKPQGQPVQSRERKFPEKKHAPAKGGTGERRFGKPRPEDPRKKRKDTPWSNHRASRHFN